MSQPLGGTPIKLEAKLHLVDSCNSGGVLVDAIRCCKMAEDRGMGGVLVGFFLLLTWKSPMT
jgi:myo-inositol-1-phosphate synthase